MAMRLVPLQAQNGETVLINPDQVRSVIIMGIGSKIEFGPDHAVPVTATLENIQKLLANRGRAKIWTRRATPSTLGGLSRPVDIA
jgi:hypothetical protein